MIEHIIEKERREFHQRFNSFWDRNIKTWLSLPCIIIEALLLYLHFNANSIILQIIFMLLAFLLLPLAWFWINNLQDSIEDYVFKEFIQPKIIKEHTKTEETKENE